MVIFDHFFSFYIFYKHIYHTLQPLIPFSPSCPSGPSAPPTSVHTTTYIHISIYHYMYVFFCVSLCLSFSASAIRYGRFYLFLYYTPSNEYRPFSGSPLAEKSRYYYDTTQNPIFLFSLLEDLPGRKRKHQ